MQISVEFPEEEKKDRATIPIEDTGLILLDDPQIIISNALLAALMENNTAIVICNASHLPFALLLPMSSHSTFSEIFRYQVNASLPLMKNLWQQTVIAKIENQSGLLKRERLESSKLDYLAGIVRSGDTSNTEGRAAACYWDSLFGKSMFLRDRFGEAPNNLLNYGYAVLRAIIARSLVGAGLFPSIGIHHRNKYNPYCLADDIMEPYRPFVDDLVLSIAREEDEIEVLSPALKKKLLQIPVADVEIDGRTSPLMMAAQRTASSLASCFIGESRKILYPSLNGSNANG